MIEALWLNPHIPVAVLNHAVAFVHVPAHRARMRSLVKRAWVLALRSGKYDQLRSGGLHDQRHEVPGKALGRYSAGGVLCDIYLRVHGLRWTGPDGIGRFSCLDNPSFIPQPIWDWAGLPEWMPIDLNQLNQRYPFSVIALIIEANL